VQSEFLGTSSEENQEKHGGALKIKKNLRSTDLSPKNERNIKARGNIVTETVRSDKKRLRYLATDVDSYYYLAGLILI
jgi:hypothetical protein